MLPGTRGDGVVVLNLLAADLVPLRAFGVEVEHVEAVIVSNDAGLSSSVEGGTGKFLDLLVLAEVESLEGISGGFVEGDAAIVTSSEDVRTPGKGVGDGRVLNLELCLGIQVEGDQRGVQVPSDDVVTVRGVRQRYHEGVESEQRLTLIRL